jgi:hypothetical protein
LVPQRFKDWSNRGPVFTQACVLSCGIGLCMHVCFYAYCYLLHLLELPWSVINWDTTGTFNGPGTVPSNIPELHYSSSFAFTSELLYWVSMRINDSNVACSLVLLELLPHWAVVLDYPVQRGFILM